MLREPQMKQQKESTASNFMSVNGPQHTKITASTTLSTFWYNEDPSITVEMH
jgi:hypothetical protein